MDKNGVAALDQDQGEELYLEEVEETEDQDDPGQFEDVEDTGEAINTLELEDRYGEEDFPEADLIPTAFLGH